MWLEHFFLLSYSARKRERTGFIWRRYSFRSTWMVHYRMEWMICVCMHQLMLSALPHCDIAGDECAWQLNVSNNFLFCSLCSLHILSIRKLPFDVFDMDRFLASLVHHEIDKDFCMNKFAISWNDHQHWTEHIFFFIIQKCCLDTFRVSLPSAHRGGNAFKQSTIRMSLRVSHSIS